MIWHSEALAVAVVVVVDRSPPAASEEKRHLANPGSGRWPSAADDACGGNDDNEN